MQKMTLGSFLFWLAVVIIVPALVIHFTLGRKGGHRMLEKRGMTRDEVRDLPLHMLKKRTEWNLRGSAAAMIGLFGAAALYPLACYVGLPLNVFGIAEEKLPVYTAGGIVLLIVLGPALLRRLRGDRD